MPCTFSFSRLMKHEYKTYIIPYLIIYFVIKYTHTHPVINNHSLYIKNAHAIGKAIQLARERRTEIKDNLYENKIELIYNIQSDENINYIYFLNKRLNANR